MAYKKTTWKDRVVEYPNRYQQTPNDDGTVNMERRPGNVLEEGTTVTAERMNRIEQGVEQALCSLGDIGPISDDEIDALLLTTAELDDIGMLPMTESELGAMLT